MLFLAHLQREPIGLSVGEIAVINKELFLSVSRITYLTLPDVLFGKGDGIQKKCGGEPGGR